MDYIVSKDILQLSLKLYRILGETFDGSDSSMKLKIFRLITCSVLILNFILTIGSFGQANRGLYIRSLEDTMSVMHVCANIFFLTRIIMRL